MEFIYGLEFSDEGLDIIKRFNDKIKEKKKIDRLWYIHCRMNERKHTNERVELLISRVENM